MWVRGLKHKALSDIESQLESHPMWVRGLKQDVCLVCITDLCRTPCGCVD